MPTVHLRSGASHRPARRSTLAAALALTVAGIAASAPAASATVWRAAADDPVDAAFSPGRDIVRAELAYDDAAGAASAAITLRGAPTGDRAATLILGRKDAAGVCEVPALAIVGVSMASGTGGNWKLVDGGGAEVASGNDVTLQEAGASVTLAAASSALAGGAYDCAEVQTLDASSASGATLRDTVYFPALTADPPPAPPAPPAPGPAPTPPPPAPKVPAPKKAPALQVAASGLPKAVVRGRRYRVTVRVRNVGTAVAKRLRLTVPKAAGIRVTPTRASWKRLAAGKSVTRRITVRATTTRARSLRLRVTGSGKLSATTTLRVVPKATKKRKAPAKKKAKRKAPSTSAPAKGPLVGRYFWGFKSHTDRAWDNYAIYFVDDRWAFVGFPPEGVPTTCQAPGADGDGCQRYTLDAGSGALQVGAKSGTWKSGSEGGLTFDEIRMSELALPPAGARYDVSLVHKGFSGMCGFITGCTTWSYTLGMKADGTFVRTSSSQSSLGGSGTPYVWAGQFPPNETGNYEILSGGRIRLAYLDGTVKVHTIGLELDKAGKPAPATEGMLLDDTNFYTSD